MKRERNPARADREDPAWNEETFEGARKAQDVLPEVFGKSTGTKMLKPRGRSKSGRARTSIALRLPPDTLARWKPTGPGKPEWLRRFGFEPNGHPERQMVRPGSFLGP